MTSSQVERSGKIGLVRNPAATNKAIGYPCGFRSPFAQHEGIDLLVEFRDVNEKERRLE